ncbi:M64 family metallopeptidase [Streptomyces sp. NPDC004647]|uniref:M64 family metallopeptidase n=1 Tax=Streptomyces sp. NPDC004647 TaxID=3154671 RepID=UPI0033A7E7FD
MRTGIGRLGAACGVAVATLLAATSPIAAASDPGAAAPPSGQDRDGHRVEYFSSPTAHPRHVEVPAATPRRLAGGSGSLAGDGDVTPIVENGPTDDKLDVVVIGDGYTSAELDRFHTDAKEKWHEITGVEPYTRYQNLFNVWAVDAVSAQSGVSGDPSQDVVKDTALDTYFWCDGLERLLCVDTDKVEGYAAKAPEADLVIVVANSAKYGGAGYNDVVSQLGYDGIATVAGGNEQSGQVAVHETGHSLGKLADEYFYDEYGEYTGPEPPDVNTSTHTARELADLRAKWYRWLGEPTPDGGTIAAFEGGGYHPKGLYRPSENSIMRTLGREFNTVGREAMIAGFYRHATSLASSTPTDRRLTRKDTVRVRVPRPAGEGSPVALRWYLDGKEVRSLRGDRTVAVKKLIGRHDWRTHRLTARAQDPTPAVRDPALRAELTDTLTWTAGR